jgi:hypothetical protein
MFGAWYRPISAHYFDGVTTIFYRPVAHDDLPDHMKAYSLRIIAARKDPRQWLKEIVDAYCRNPKWQSLLRPLLDSLPYGKVPVRAASKLTKSQRKLLQRFNNPAMRS